MYHHFEAWTSIDSCIAFLENLILSDWHQHTLLLPTAVGTGREGLVLTVRISNSSPFSVDWSSRPVLIGPNLFLLNSVLLTIFASLVLECWCQCQMIVISWKTSVSNLANYPFQTLHSMAHLVLSSRWQHTRGRFGGLFWSCRTEANWDVKSASLVLCGQRPTAFFRMFCL